MDIQTEAHASACIESNELLRKVVQRLEDLILLQRVSLLGPSKVFDFLCRDEKIRFFLPYAGSDLIQRQIIKFNAFFEMNLLDRFKKYIPKDASIIDAGANIGNHSVYFAKICKARSVHAFEPMRETFRILARNAQLNAPSQIFCHDVALGTNAARADLQRYIASNTGAARMCENVGGFYEVRSIDSFCFQSVDVLKIDVEGAQISLLDGARETLSRCKPVIWIELLREDAEDGDHKLRLLGYERVENLSGTDFVYRAKGRS